MKNHLLAVEHGGKQGRYMDTRHMAGVLKTIKALGGKAKAAPREGLGGKSIEEMLAKAAKFPSVKKALAALGSE